MQYELLTTAQADEIRSQFENAFIKTPQEYDISYKKWLEEYLKTHNIEKTFPTLDYNEVVYWSKLKSFAEILFEDAIEFLKEIKNPVYFLSDPYSERNGMNILYDKPVGFVATTNDATAFAEFIYDDWRKLCNLPDDVWIDPILPEDLYVFDDSMKWMLAFTHSESDGFPNIAPEALHLFRLCLIIT